MLIAVLLLLCGNATAQSSGVGLDEERPVPAGLDGPLHAAVRRETTWLAYGTRPDHQTVTKPGPNWFVRHPVMTGTLVGTGAGLALSRVDSIGGVNHDPRVGLIGAAVGAWGGLIASAAQKSRAGHKVGAGSKDRYGRRRRRPHRLASRRVLRRGGLRRKLVMARSCLIKLTLGLRRERAPRASHAIGPPTPRLRRGLAVALRAEAEASRRSGERERV